MLYEEIEDNLVAERSGESKLLYLFKGILIVWIMKY